MQPFAPACKVAAMELHQGENELFRGRPSWRSLFGFHAGILVLALAGGVIGKLADSVGVGIAIAAAVLLVGVFIGFMRRIGTKYVITNERLHIRKGLLTKNIQETRIDRVQNVNTHQSVMQRMLRVGDIDFDTAGSDDSDFRFDGVGGPERVVRAVDVAQRERQQAAPPTGAPPAPPAPTGL